MAACLAPVASVRKEVRGVAARTTSDIVDCVITNTRQAKLVMDQCCEVTVRFGVSAVDDSTASRSAFHFDSDFFADFERTDANMRADRNDEPRRVVS
jgi:hypothetical protein